MSLIKFRGKRQIELAEDVLVLFYEAKNAIEFIRSPLSFPEEGSTRKRTEDETSKQAKAWDMAYVAFERYEKRREVFSKLNSLRYRFIAQIGRDKAEPFDEIREVLNKIFSASRRLAQLWVRLQQSSNKDKLENLSEKIQKYEAILWSGELDDEIDKRINKAISQMEETCCKVIMRK